jgi:anti-sigma factor RsiW
MCPDPQLLSVYLDGELPSPWKEKMESHLSDCPRCREKLESYKRLFDESVVPSEQSLEEQAAMEDAKNRVWRKLQPFIPEEDFRSMRRFQPRSGIWRKRVSIPLPAAAAAAIILTVLATLVIRGGQVQVPQIAQAADTNMILASEEDMPGIFPADMNGVLQYLGSDGDILILRLPESRHFVSFGEPAIIKAADYTRRQP